MRSSSLVLPLAVLLMLVGFVWRVLYVIQSHTHLDEYYSIFAAQMIQQRAYPLLPSGLFYSHGLLYSYLLALLGGLMSAAGGPIERIELVYRLPNVLFSVLAMAVLFGVVRRWLGSRAALLALALLVVYPHGIVWGARARMYTLVFAFVPWLAYAFFRLAVSPRERRWSWLALGALLLGALIHNWVILLVPPLVVGVTLVGWQTDRVAVTRWRWWLPKLAGLAGITALSSYLQSLWLETPVAASQNRGWQGIIDGIAARIDVAAAFSGTSDFLFNFAWDNTFNLVVIGLTLVFSLGLILLAQTARRQPRLKSRFWAMAFLYVVLIFTTAEFVLLLGPGLKQARYAAPLLVIVFMILGGWFDLILAVIFQHIRLSPAGRQAATVASVGFLLAVFGWLSYRQLPKLFYEGLPAVGYDRAFQFIHRQAPVDAPVLSPLPVAAQLYLDNPIYFIAQNAIHTFVHTNPQGVLADRWVGAPWLKSVDQLKAMLQNNATVWLVIDQFSFDTQFNAAWKQLLRQNTEMIWNEDGVMVFRADGLVHDVPAQPDIPLDMQLGGKLKLAGYSRQISPEGLHLILFWEVLSVLGADYTTFVHVRDSSGNTVAQADIQPLAGTYPTSRWQPGEIVTDEILLPLPPDLPPGTYRLLVGMYRWDTLQRLPVRNDPSGENAILLESIKIQPHER